MAEEDEPEPEHDEHDFTPSLAELASEHPRALSAREAGASPLSAERLGHQTLFAEQRQFMEQLDEEAQELTQQMLAAQDAELAQEQDRAAAAEAEVNEVRDRLDMVVMRHCGAHSGSTMPRVPLDSFPIVVNAVRNRTDILDTGANTVEVAPRRGAGRTLTRDLSHLLPH